MQSVYKHKSHVCSKIIRVWDPVNRYENSDETAVSGFVDLSLNSTFRPPFVQLNIFIVHSLLTNIKPQITLATGTRSLYKPQTTADDRRKNFYDILMTELRIYASHNHMTNMSLCRVIQKEVHTFKNLFYENYWR
jgi:hypothetical protein